VSDLKLIGTPLEGQTLTVTGTYYGGKEGKSELVYLIYDFIMVLTLN
jgi:hypothetical protein